MKSHSSSKNIRRLRALASFVALSGLCTLGPTAAGAARKGINELEVGNQYAGFKGSYSASAENRNRYARTDLAATGTVKFLKKTAKGVEFTVTTKLDNGRKSSSYCLQVAGFTVDTGERKVSYNWSKAVNKTLLPCNLGLAVGPIPVTITGSVGGGASIGYRIELEGSGVGVLGQASAWANGSAAAGIGVPLLNLALKSDLQLAKTSLEPTMSVTPNGMAGATWLAFEPVKIDFAVAILSLTKEVYRQNLASYSAPARRVCLLKL